MISYKKTMLDVLIKHSLDFNLDMTYFQIQLQCMVPPDQYMAGSDEDTTARW